MTPDEYLRELAQAITQQEDLNDEEARDVLYELALRIYALLLNDLPDERLERYMRWRQLRTRIILNLLAVNDRIAQQLYNRLATTELLVSEVARRYFQLPNGAVTSRPLTQVLDTTRVVGVQVSRLFVPNPRTGISPFVLQMLQLTRRLALLWLLGGQHYSKPGQPQHHSLSGQAHASLGLSLYALAAAARAWAKRCKLQLRASLSRDNQSSSFGAVMGEF